MTPLATRVGDMTSDYDGAPPTTGIESSQYVIIDKVASAAKIITSPQQETGYGLSF